MNEQLKNLKDTKEQRIFNDLQNKLDYMKKNYPSLNIIAIYLQGSQNYELDDEYSDIDTIAICLPTLDDLITKSNKESNVYIMNDNSHIEVKDIRLLKTLLYKQNPKYFEVDNLTSRTMLEARVVTPTYVFADNENTYSSP